MLSGFWLWLWLGAGGGARYGVVLMAGEPDAGSQGVESEVTREALIRSWRARRARRVEGVRGGGGALAEGGGGAEMMLALGWVLMGG